jgi:asparagine synthase (glutamine-hydrolysing)
VSVQFGRWEFDGGPTPNVGVFDAVQDSLALYGPDGTSFYTEPGVRILYRALHSTKESRQEVTLHLSPSGAVITWDGRLDNRKQLIRELGDELKTDSPDFLIATVAFERWGTNCFARLIGDWAVSIWQSRQRSLILAKDPLGTRHLYYSFVDSHVTWSTLLDPLLNVGDPLALEEEYIAGWLSSFPAAHLTPYTSIRSVPPSCFVCIERKRLTMRKYWDFDPTKAIRYRSDGEYEEHFREVFTESVRRRLRSDFPILAELSGGMDSSSIVCVADRVISTGAGEAPRVDTVSYYDDTEPAWNERSFFTRVEEWRTRTGLHIDVSSHDAFQIDLNDRTFTATPASGGRPTEASKQFSAHVGSQGYRALLCGTGGDEVMGGVPSPIPELANLLARGRLLAFARQLKAWSLNKRKPWIHLALETVQCFLPPGIFGGPPHQQPVPWVGERLIKVHGAACGGYDTRLKLIGPLPSFQENLAAIEAIRRHLACCEPASRPPYDKHYPYLDRDLLEFIFAIPREQVVRPGQRRSLARRALRGIVPPEVLDRKSKAFVARGPMVAFLRARPALIDMARNMISGSSGFIEANVFLEALREAGSGNEVPVVQVLRTVALESWLRGFPGAKPFEPNRSIEGPVLPPGRNIAAETVCR